MLWYRARFIHHYVGGDPEVGEAVVLLVDYGNIFKIEVQDLIFCFMVTQNISRFQTLHLKKQVKMRASNGRDLLKGLRGGHVVITSRHGTGVGSMGRKVEEFELSTKLMNSEKLKKLV